MNVDTTIVAGAGGRIGRALTLSLTAQGKTVAVVDPNPEIHHLFEKEVKLGRLLVFKEDATDPQQLDIVIGECERAFGPVTGAVNCSYPRDKNFSKINFEKATYKNFSNNLTKHLNSYVWLSKMTADRMKKFKTKGVIINLSSIYGLVSQDLEIYKKTKIRENFAYCIIKSGIISHTNILASYYGKFGIRANCVCPGGVERTDKFSKNIKDKTFKKNYFNRLSIKRFAKADDIANAIIFLASDNASYITGVSLPVDGGFTIKK